MKKSEEVIATTPLLAIDLFKDVEILTLERFLVVRALMQQGAPEPLEVARARKVLFEAVCSTDWPLTTFLSMTIAPENYGLAYKIRMNRDQIRALLEFCDKQIERESGINAFALIDLRDRLYMILAAGN